MYHLQRISKKTTSELICTTDMGIESVVEMTRCVHCGYHWQIIPGSGRKRGFCTKCCGPTCGKKECDTCIPHMKKLGY